jgi:hypothetical protein
VSTRNFFNPHNGFGCHSMGTSWVGRVCSGFVCVVALHGVKGCVVGVSSSTVDSLVGEPKALVIGISIRRASDPSSGQGPACSGRCSVIVHFHANRVVSLGLSGVWVSFGLAISEIGW